MKLVRYGEPGQEKPAMLDNEGRLRDLSAQITDIGPVTLNPATLQKLLTVKPADLPLVTGDPRIGPCVGSVGKIVAIGLNYADHAAEAGMEVPADIPMFMKATSSICGPNDDIFIPKGAKKVDWEIEIGVVIGTKATNVAEADALQYVAGYCVVNDVSERDFQLNNGTQWSKGKGCDTFGPLGPWLVTKDEIADPQNLALWTIVNGKKMQNGSTKNMVNGVAKLIAYASRFMSLLPGDIISTGTPAGVGGGMKPAVFLKAGDVVVAGVEGLGEQRQIVSDPWA